MDSRHIVLKLFVEELGLQGEIDSFQNRKNLQKAVYLGQLSGIDLGYRYSWYLRGPYSTGLARDYYQLAEAIRLGDRGFESRSLNDPVKQKLCFIKKLLTVPRDCFLSTGDWMELLASWHYLRSVSRSDESEARNLMEKQKPTLAPHIPHAQRALLESRLLG